MKVPTFLTSALAALLISTSNPATAADKAVLVLDGSGSMWGQVGDTTKIEIARDVISDLMLDWSSKVELGLSAYGHREKGNCSDIETLKPIGPVDPKEVAQIVDGISPKGKTPLTAAVRNAAGELRYEEDRATVILVSDGEETCGGDPCALARELEAAGIDFTVHVVGFDLTDEETANLQCIADNTGGKFLQASDAEELHEAMAEVKEVVVQKAQVDLVNPPQYSVGTEWVWEKNAGTLVTRRVTESNGSTYNYKDSDGCAGSTNTEIVGGGSWQNCLGSTGWIRPTDRSGSLYPLSVGNSEQISFVGQLEGQSSQFRTVSICSVASLEEVSVPAGTFDAYRITCEGEYGTTDHYFGIEIGTILIWDQFNKTNGKRNTYKLVSFKRG